MKIPFVGTFRLTRKPVHKIVLKKHKAHLTVLIADTLFWTIDGLEKFGTTHVLMIWGVGVLAVLPVVTTLLSHVVEFVEEEA